MSGTSLSSGSQGFYLEPPSTVVSDVPGYKVCKGLRRRGRKGVGTRDRPILFLITLFDVEGSVDYE